MKYFSHNCHYKLTAEAQNDGLHQNEPTISNGIFEIFLIDFQIEASSIQLRMIIQDAKMKSQILDTP